MRNLKHRDDDCGSCVMIYKYNKYTLPNLPMYTIIIRGDGDILTCYNGSINFEHLSLSKKSKYVLIMFTIPLILFKI
jgi:hypothetical protein